METDQLGLGEISCGCFGGVSRLNLRSAVDDGCSLWLAFHWVQQLCCTCFMCWLAQMLMANAHNMTAVMLFMFYFTWLFCSQLVCILMSFLLLLVG